METDKNIYTLSNVLQSRGGKRIKSIIKENAIEYSQPVPIGGEQEEQMNTGHENDRVEPIIENDEVVGIIHYCQCGKSTEIRFDY